MAVGHTETAPKTAAFASCWRSLVVKVVMAGVGVVLVVLVSGYWLLGFRMQLSSAMARDCRSAIGVATTSSADVRDDFVRRQSLRCLPSCLCAEARNRRYYSS